MNATGPLARSRVLPLLAVLMLAVALSTAFVTVAPNRIVSGTPVMLAALVSPAAAPALAPALVVLAALVIKPTRGLWWAVAVAGAALLAGCAWIAGSAALAAPGRRVAPAGACWCLMGLAWLAAADALQRLALQPRARLAAHVALWLPLATLAGWGALDALSVFQELAQREEVFREAFTRHLVIVVMTLAGALAIGYPLGWTAARHARSGRLVLNGLGIVQTIPSVALFGLLIAPLAALGAWWPASGIHGVGLAPALVALVAYALLPIVQGVAAGFRQIDPGILQAADGMGFSAAARALRVEVPLALPALVSALRVAAVQVVGLAVVAALIGAGGLGSLVFQGLASAALDLVLLGVVPTVALAVVLDALLALLADGLRVGVVARRGVQRSAA